jgi:hypothetical protein
MLPSVASSELLQQIADDPQHRLVVIDDEDVHLHIDRHLEFLSASQARCFDLI